MKKTISTLLLCFLSCWAIAQAPHHQRVQVPAKTLDYINRAADGDHLALEGGHLALDGHVMPYPFFQSHEVLYLYRLSQLRHQTIWKADSVIFDEDWKAGNEKNNGSATARTIAPSELVGGRHTTNTYWFQLPELPESKTGFERFFCLRPVELTLIGWPETTIYVNGESRAALPRQHFYWSLNQILDQQGPQQICMKSFGVYDMPRGYKEISVVERNPELDELYWYTRVLIEAVSIMYPEEKGYQEMRDLADHIMAAIDLDLAGTVGFNKKVTASLKTIKASFEKIEKMADHQSTLYMLVHGHLDSAWRWTLGHTDDKIERLVLNNLYLMDRYPEYKYVFTTPYHYERLKEFHPHLYERVLEKIQQGQWTAKGSTYVETDMNMPGGESIVRQFLYGLDYYKHALKTKEFALFLPDTFGYPPYLPQIANSFGLDHLVAMRVDVPQLDHTIFNYKGIDGSKILVNGLSTPAWEYPFVDAIHGHHIQNPDSYTTYNAPDPGPRRARGTWERFKDQDITDKQLMLIGWGDGGGGGTEDQLELMRLGKSLPSFPKIEWTNMNDYIDLQLAKKDEFPTYDRRLLDRPFIQRTFLMANGIKMNNRAAEQRLREAEALGTWATQYGYEYPAEALKATWKKLLVMHFHDIITGMAVPEVLMEANVTIQEVEAAARKHRDAALTVIKANIQAEEDGLLLFNPSAVNKKGLVKLNAPKVAGKFHLVDEDFLELPFEKDQEQLLVAIDDFAPMSFKKIYVRKGKSTIKSAPLTAKNRTLENDLVKVSFNEQGEIISYFDKQAQRELVPAGKVQNRLLEVVHPGTTMAKVKNDGSITDPKQVAQTITAKAKFSQYKQNSLMASLTIERQVAASSIKQRVVLHKDDKQLTFETDMDWNEEQHLEVDFPMDFATKVANHGIQWGSMEVTRSSYADYDTLEKPTCAHQWADISDEGYGMAVLDNTRYGYNMKEGGIRLVLSYGQHKHGYSELKNVAWGKKESGEYGGEKFKYALLPHEGNHISGRVIQKAKQFNTEIITESLNKQNGTANESFLTGMPENIMLQTIKKAENGKDWIVRLYETEQKHTSCKLVIEGQAAAKVFSANMNEGIGEPITVNDSAIGLSFRPFEIKTLIIKPSQKQLVQGK